MALPNDYTRTVSITPISTAYSWDTPPSWITITQVGSTDNWTIRIAVNTGASRTATLTVRHDNTSTTDTLAVSQAAGTSSGSGGGAGPTATPAPSPTSAPNPTATSIPPTPVPPTPVPPTPIPPTPVPPTPVPPTPVPPTPIPPTPIPPTSSGGAGYVMSFPNGDTSFFIDDTQGAGNGTDAVTFGMTGTGSEGAIVPTIISQDSRITVSMQYGVFMAGLHRGSINITSNDPGSSTPQGLILSNLVLAHALDNSATASLSGNLVQYQIPAPNPTATPFAFPTATPYSSGGGGGGGGCHLAGEMITMSNGEKVAIENISAGDSLLSVKINGMSNEELAYESWSSNINAFSIDYTSVNIQTVKVDTYTSYYNFNNDALKITFEHPILVKTSDNLVLFKIARDVNVGDNFLNENNEWISIVTKVLIEDVAPFTTYTIDVEPEDTYFANGVLVHNIVNEKENYL